MDIGGKAVKVVGEAAGGKFFWSLSLLATLFFMWGFITVLNDALTPHLKSVFVMDYAQAALIQVSWFLGYLVFSWPSANGAASIFTSLQNWARFRWTRKRSALSRNSNCARKTAACYNRRMCWCRA